MKKKVLVAIVTAILGVMPCLAGALVSDSRTSGILIHIRLTNGTDIVYDLSGEPQMTFGDKTMTLHSREGVIGRWDFTDVESWNFSDIDEDDLDAVGAEQGDNARIRIEGGRITVTGGKTGKIAIYDMGGRLVATSPDTDTGSGIASISVAGLAKGTYILKAGDSTAKFVLK